MQQTRKQFKLTTTNGVDSYVEDVNGFIPGYTWTDANGLLRRVLFTVNVFETVRETSTASCRYEMFEPETEQWIITKAVSSQATMTDYVDVDGVYEPEPFEEDGVTLKAGLTPQFEFWYDILIDLYTPAMQDILVRKFGATSFN